MEYALGVDEHDPADDAPEHELPTSLVPRWLAWIVFVALLAAATASSCMILHTP